MFETEKKLLFDDKNFIAVKSFYSRTTIFNILKIERNENRHSAFLAWLLDVNGSHNLKDAPLKNMLGLLFKHKSIDEYLPLSIIQKIDPCTITTEEPVELNKKKGRIDIFATFDVKTSDNISKQFVLILENKIGTDEHNEQTTLYYDWAVKNPKYKDATIIPVFLSPSSEISCSCDKYIKITYQDVLNYIIEPLGELGMDENTRMIIEDYIINLGQPQKSENFDNGHNVGLENILATSEFSNDLSLQLYNSHKELFDNILCAKNSSNQKCMRRLFPNEYSNIVSRISSESNKYADLWNDNKPLFQVILHSAFSQKTDGDEDFMKQVRITLGLSESNRDNTKYLVYVNADDNKPIDNMKSAPKSLTSFYIFKAWLHKNPKASLADIRKAFSVKECAPHYNGTYQFLFYRWADGDAMIDHSDETIKDQLPEKKYVEWDFFKGSNAEKYHLELSDAPKVMTQKMWHKDQFDFLVKYAYDNYGILTKEAK